MNLKSLISVQNLFQVNAAYVSPGEKLFFFFGLILILLGVVFKISAVLSENPIDKKFRNKFFRLFLSIGISLGVWYLCRIENVMFFATHFVALVILLIGIVWLVNIIMTTFKNYKTEKTVWEKEEVKQKYLPK